MKYRTDKNHLSIVTELRARSICTEDLSKSGGGLLDIVTHCDSTVFIEIKVEGSTAKIKKSQLRFISSWAGHCGIARTFDEAFNLAVSPERYALTQRQKDILGAYHATMTAKEVSLNTILKLIAG